MADGGVVHTAKLEGIDTLVNSVHNSTHRNTQLEIVLTLKSLVPLEAQEATHYLMGRGRTVAGGSTVTSVVWFKKVDGVWYHFTTDSDNEYPQWGKAEGSYFRPVSTLNILPLE